MAKFPINLNEVLGRDVLQGETMDFTNVFSVKNHLTGVVTPTTPDSVTLTIVPPQSRRPVTLAFPGANFTNPALGLLICRYQLAEYGDYQVEWESTGAVATVSLSVLKVVRNPLYSGN